MELKNFVCSCVVDNHPKFHNQGRLWVNCLLRYQKIPAQQIYVHLVQPNDGEFEKWLYQQGVQIIKVNTFDARSLHCNKLTQLVTAFDKKVKYVILMDCDTVWLGNDPLPEINQVGGKIVDNPNPAPEILSSIFTVAGFTPQWTEASFAKAEGVIKTDRNNCNGGLYIITREMLSLLAATWTRWARWCLDNRELFGRSIHFDQVSYALSAHELGIDTKLLGMEWNYPNHHPEWELPNVEPQIIHYHHCINEQGQIMLVNKSLPDAAIIRFNQFINEIIN